VDVSIGGVNGTADFDVGFRAGVGVGYNFTRNLGVEFDTGWIWNQFKDSDDSLSHHPFMVNGVYRFETHSKFVPYIGAGLGGTYSVLDVDSGNINDDDGDVVFAWQAMAGVRYMFNDNMSFGVGYKYHGTTEGSYNIDGLDIEISSVHNHSFSVVFNMTF
jgi:opacity protein-like surface antigen